MTKKYLIYLCVFVLGANTYLDGWGLRGHTIANLVAVESISADGPMFLKGYKAYIGHLGVIPDTWRGGTEPFLRISEDPNHGWYTESFGFIKEVPHSRTEFTLKVYDEYLRVSKTNPERAKMLNIRYTGLQAYSMMEGYERMKAGMRLYRFAGYKSRDGHVRDLASLYAPISPELGNLEQIKSFLAEDVAFYMGWLGHYVADAAQPLHNSQHHDGWAGDDPKGYTRDPNIHERFESTYLDLIRVSEANVLPLVPKKPRYLSDPWTAILDHMLEARNYTEEIYRLDLQGAFGRTDNAEARQLVYKRLASGAGFLRDLAYTAWIESGKPFAGLEDDDTMSDPKNPKYNPATGSAPAP
jgi:hypothetical protein